MPGDPLRGRRERRVLEQRAVEVVRTLRRVVEEDVRALAEAAGCRRDVAVLRESLDAATTPQQLLALEVGILQAQRELGVQPRAGRLVRVGERLVPWESLGSSYRGVLDAALTAAKQRRHLDAYSAPDRRPATAGERSPSDPLPDERDIRRSPGS